MSQNEIRLEENKMGTMPVGRLLASMAIPMMLSMLVQALYNIVDSIYVSQIGENALNAVSLAFPLQSLMIAFGSGTTVGVNARLSRCLGAKQQDKVDQTANTAIFLAFLMYAFFAVIGFFGSRLFFLAQTNVEEIVNGGTIYTTICLCCSIGIFCQFTFERLLQATGRTKLSMLTQLIGAIINIILDPIMIFGRFGIPAMGIAGAAVATVIGQLCAGVIGLVMNLKFNREVHLRPNMIRWHTETVVEIYKVGIPSIIMQSIGSVMTFCLNKILIGFTTTATAVFGAYFKLQSFVFMPIFGMNSGLVPIVSYNLGAKKPDRLWKTVRIAIISAVTIMLIGVAAFELFPAQLLGLFNPSEKMLELGVPALRIIGTHFWMAGFCIIANSVCQAVGNPMHTLIVSFCRQIVVLLPLAWLLAQTGRLELVWLAFPISEATSVFLCIFFLRSTVKSVENYIATH